MGTEWVARDLDILRSAVGDTRLNYYGVSYGTMIGTLYAEFFPSRVGLLVLDSAVLPDAPTEPEPTQQDVAVPAEVVHTQRERVRIVGWGFTGEWHASRVSARRSAG